MGLQASSALSQCTTSRDMSSNCTLLPLSMQDTILHDDIQASDMLGDLFNVVSSTVSPSAVPSRISSIINSSAVPEVP